jgi:hypothetical protein
MMESGLYKKLWNEIVPLQEEAMKKDKAIQEVGYPEYPDQMWEFSLKGYWDKFNDDEKRILIEAVKKHQEEWA